MNADFACTRPFFELPMNSPKTNGGAKGGGQGGRPGTMDHESTVHDDTGEGKGEMVLATHVMGTESY